MTKTNTFIPISDLLRKFIIDTEKGRRLQKNGKLVTASTIKNYKALEFNIKEFSQNIGEILLVNTRFKDGKRALETERRKYKKFYKKFTD